METSTTTLILDGIWGRPRRFHVLRDLLRRTCGPADVFPYDCSGRAAFETLGRSLGDRIRAIGSPVNLVGFSMGGIVIRAAQLLDSALPIRRAAFLNVPHRGTWLAYASPFSASRQLRPNSPLMRRLAEAPWDIPTLVTWCPFDAIIVPGSSANWGRATVSIRSMVPLHPWPAWSRRIHNRIAQFFSAPDTGASDLNAQHELSAA